MDRFSELISRGVASFNYKPTNSSIADDCPLCRSYNNIFSIATDTHMSCIDGDMKIITGHIVSDKVKFDKFIWACQYGGVNFNTTGYISFADWMNKVGLVGRYDFYNGDSVYILEPHRTTKNTQPELGEPDNVITSFTTEDSTIPQPIRLLTKDNNVDSFKECVKNTLEETATAMNESRYIYGDSWMVTNFSDGPHIIGVVNNKYYKL